MTAPTMAPSTTPPATILSKKFFKDGDTAASATSGTTIEAVSATAVNPVTAFSLSDAATWNLTLLLLLFPPPSTALLGSLTGNGLRNGESLLTGNGIAIETAEVEAISDLTHYWWFVMVLQDLCTSFCCWV
ncbi:hypothetical protein Scep_007946 [Stephania cephalantha]|uniref:Uncharacterized protein n=1 Tax=Stephania cephalantha TaxID=152367 RepID=A0AAP0KCI4_9MAGN